MATWNLFGRKGHGGPGGGQKSFADARERQIQSMFEKMPGIERKQADNTLFEVPLHVPPDGRTVQLRIFLPTRFPEDRPVLQLLSEVQHSWVNQYMQIVGHPQLANWDGAAALALSQEHLLGSIIADIAAEFRGALAGSGASGASNGTAHSASPPRQHPYGGASSQYNGVPSQGGYGVYSASPSGYFGQQQPMGGASGVYPGAAQPGRSQQLSQAAIAAQQQQDGPSFVGGPAYQPVRPMQGGTGVMATLAGSGAAAASSGALSQPGAAMKSASGATMDGSTSSARSGASGAEEHRIRLPPVPASFEELEGMSLAQLQRLHEDDVARHALLESLAVTQSMREVRADLRTGNAATAEASMVKQAELGQRRAEVVALQAQLRRLQEEHEAEAAAYSRRTGGDDDHEILRRIRTAVKAAEAASEDTASAFLGGSMPINDFLEKFCKERQQFHLLAAKMEYVKEQGAF